MDIRVGDIIECKKTRDGIGIPANKKNHFYKILFITDNIVTVNTENEYKNSSFSLVGNPKKYYLFKEYFITKNDIRKEKIKKLNESWR